MIDCGATADLEENRRVRRDPLELHQVPHLEGRQGNQTFSTRGRARGYGSGN